MLAHSLGNMVVSSMIQDHGLQVGRYLMCNSAVPCEALYDRDDVSVRVPQLVHPEWVDYPTNAWASTWHRHFDGVEVGPSRTGKPLFSLGTVFNSVPNDLNLEPAER